MHRLLWVPLLLLAALPTAGAAASVQVMGGFYDPASITVLPGESVTWTNGDAMPHTVTSSWDDGASFDKVLRAGESFTYAFPSSGSFTVHCRPHEGMQMTVTVQRVQAEAGIHGGLSRVPAGGFALVTLALVGATLLSTRRTRR